MEVFRAGKTRLIRALWVTKSRNGLVRPTISGCAIGGPITEDLSKKRRDALYPRLGNVQSGRSINMIVPQP